MSSNPPIDPRTDAPGSPITAGGGPSQSELDAPQTFDGALHRPSARPALIVLGIVAVVVGGGAALALAGSSPHAAGGKTEGRLRGVSLDAESAAPVLARITQDGDPPADIIAALVVPVGSVVSATSRPPNLDLYEGSVTLSVNASVSTVVQFYKAELRHAGWGGLSTDAPADGSGTEVLATHASADGFYWEVGVTASSVTPSISPALAGGSATASTTSLNLTVFEVDDGD